MNGVDEERTARIGRLKWHCRRALLELDLIFTRFWERHGDVLDAQTEVTLTRLLEFEDHDLWALVNGKDSTDDVELVALIKRLREV
jgi:antitoxin CptB